MHRIGTDLFEFNGKQLLIMVDHYSSYPWVRRLRNISSASCIDAMKSVFSEFGYPQHIYSDFDGQYSSQEFNSFVHEFNVKHTMSNPECYVGTLKCMLKKCDNIYDALHAYRSTPLYNSCHSPYELLFNRRMKDNVISLSHSKPGPQKPTQVNSELGIQKPSQRNSELGLQKRRKEILNLARRSHCKEILNLSCKSLFVNSYRLNQKPILLIVVLLKSKRSPALM